MCQYQKLQIHNDSAPFHATCPQCRRYLAVSIVKRSPTEPDLWDVHLSAHPPLADRLAALLAPGDLAAIASALAAAGHDALAAAIRGESLP